MLAWLALTVTAEAQTPPCGPTEDIRGRIMSHYKEEPVVLGLLASGDVMEIFQAADGDWTLIRTGVDGRSCVLGAGARLMLRPRTPTEPLA